MIVIKSKDRKIEINDNDKELKIKSKKWMIEINDSDKE